MNVDLEKEDLINLVNGVSPSYDLFEITIVKKCGRYSGSYGTWDWIHSELKQLSEEELFELYNICKKK